MTLRLGGGSGAGGLFVAMLGRRELEPVLALDVDLHGVAAGDLPAQQVLRQLVFDPVRDHPPQGTRAVNPVVSLFGQ